MELDDDRYRLKARRGKGWVTLSTGKKGNRKQAGNSFVVRQGQDNKEMTFLAMDYGGRRHVLRTISVQRRNPGLGSGPLIGQSMKKFGKSKKFSIGCGIRPVPLLKSFCFTNNHPGP